MGALCVKRTLLDTVTQKPHKWAVAETIPLPALVTRRIWKVKLVDDIDRPTVQTALLIRRMATAADVLENIDTMPGYKLFSEEHKNTAIASIELAGITEN